MDKYYDYLKNSLKVIKINMKDLEKFEQQLIKQIEVNLGEDG